MAGNDRARGGVIKLVGNNGQASDRVDYTVVTNSAGEASRAIRGKVTRPECFVRQAKSAVPPISKAETLVRDKEERLVFTVIEMRKVYRAARGEAEVVLCIHGFLEALEVVEPTVGIKRAVAEVVVS